MSNLEIVASLFGAACVVLLIFRNHWSWPIGLVQVILTAVVFYQAKLYAETALQVIFAILQVYGWIAWFADSSRGKLNEKLPAKSFFAPPDIVVEELSLFHRAISLIAIGIGTGVIATLLFTFTNGNSPVADAFITAASLVAQWLLAKRYLENWVIWIVVDVVSIPLYWQRELPFFAILYVLFLVLALLGLRAWLWQVRNQAKAKALAS